jgi:shikimate kinase / 3-dehydroquinate synthase
MLPEQMTANIVLTGFMATGKSQIGQRLSERWGRTFVDMDAVLEQRFGLTVPEIFAQHGEAAFRAAETALCAELAAREGLVIASGGGALIHADNRAQLEALHTVVNLCASPKTIWQRLKNDDSRPLIATTNKMAAIQSLLKQRQGAYASIKLQISTDDKTVEEVAADIERLVLDCHKQPAMETLIVPTPTSAYPILISDGLLSRLDLVLRMRSLSNRQAVLVSNESILSFYKEPLLAALERACSSVTIVTVGDGEEHKTLATIATLYDRFLDCGLDRSGLVIALGGGVVGDMAGFAAATYLRGLRFIQIPSSLLAMVDSSVGAKTGVDLTQGKNLVGAFKQPELVVVDSELLRTLPEAEQRAGLAEVIKHGIISDRGLFEAIEEKPHQITPKLLRRAIQVKVDVVTEDPFEQGRRAVLNLGHTFGHAFEQVSGFQIRHGEAVAVGLLCAARMGAELAYCDRDLEARIARLLSKVGLPQRFTGYRVDDLLAAMVHDKKRARGRMRFIVPEALGSVRIISDPPIDVVKRAFEAGLE